jgi:O-antigen/teichoic acid export membrane protein
VSGLEQTKPETSSLKAAVLRGSALEVAGFGAAQVMRLGSNLILSRLLFPQAFGIAALVQIFNQGLVMLSDVGIEPGVVQSKRGDEELFLNTAWTMQVTRCFGLWVCSWLLAWPFSKFYGEAELLWMIPVGSFSVFASGLASTYLLTCRRHLRVGVLQAIELGSQVTGLMIMLPWAYFRPSVWALVGGGVGAAVVKSIASHIVALPTRNRFAWDPSARQAIVHFGRWIFGSSALGFLSRQSDRLLLGRYMGTAELGIYSIGLFLSDAIGMLVVKITHGVLYPLFSRLYREQPDRLQEVYYKARLVLDASGLVVAGSVCVLGTRIVHLLYDARYAQAGWMAQILCVRVAMTCVLTPCETCLFSMGQTKYGFLQNVGRTTWMIAAIPLGFHLWGLKGVVWATALSELPVASVLWPPFSRLNMIRWSREALALMFFAGGLGLGSTVDAMLPR